MNKWLRRTVGSVGVAAAVLLLSAGTAPAHGSRGTRGGVAPDLEPRVPERLRSSIEGPNMIGDDFVDQSPYVDGSASAVAVPIGTGTLDR